MSEQKQDGTDNIMWMLIGITITVIIIWFFFGRQITQFYLTVKLWELEIVNLFYSTPNIQEVINIIKTRPIRDWDMKKVTAVGTLVGWIINIPIMALLGYFTYRIWKRNPLQKFKRKHSMQTLVESEKHNWPYISTIIGLNLITQKIDEGPWAMAQKPLDYVRTRKLLDNPNELTSLNKIKAEKILASQLGKLWEGPDKLPGYTRALFAIFAAHGLKEEVVLKEGEKPVKYKDLAATALAKIAATAEGGKKPDFSAANFLVAKMSQHEEILALTNKHAYINTVMASMLIHARGTGVLPTSQFLWLKPINRQLFYTLNCVGRQVAFVEVAGIFSHWKAEIVAEKAIEKPYISKAFVGLEKALAEIKLK